MPTTSTKCQLKFGIKICQLATLLSAVEMSIGLNLDWTGYADCDRVQR